jgi:hypothetical protein
MPKYPFGANYNVLEIPDLDWSTLESVSDLSFTESQRRALITTLHRYLINCAEYHATSTMKAVQHRLTQIHTHATALRDLVLLRPTNESSIDEESNLLQAAFGSLPIFIDRTILARQLVILSKNAEVVLENLRHEGQRGRPRQEGLRVMIKKWHTTYREAGGLGLGCSWNVDSLEFQGPFLELVYGALRQVANMLGNAPFLKTLPRSKDGLAQMIRKTIRNR